MPSEAQLLFSICFDGHLAGKHKSIDDGAGDVPEAEPGILPEVQKYNIVIAAQQERLSQCIQDVQSAQEAAAGEAVDVDIFKRWYEAAKTCL